MMEMSSSKAKLIKSSTKVTKTMTQTKQYPPIDVELDAETKSHLPLIEGFKNCDYELRISGTTERDPRIMSFVDNLWGFEVTGGVDQYEPLTVIAVRRSGLARRAGIRVNDIITKINETKADKLTLLEAQLLLQEAGKSVKIFVRGDSDVESDDDMTVDYWFKPLSDSERALLDWEARMRARRNPNKWNEFPWNDRKKPIYKESNCFMVPSKAVERIISLRMDDDKSETRDNETEKQTDGNESP